MVVAISAEALPGDPAPKAGVTVTGLGVGASLVNIWRTSDGERHSVRGGRRIVMNDAGFVADWDVPLGRATTYEIEVLSGPGGPVRKTSSPLTVESDTGWLMDPLVPQTAVEITRNALPNGEPTFAASAMSKLDYVAETQVFKVLGSSRPMALFGERMAASGIDLSIVLHAAEENTRLRNLLKSTAQLLVRLPASWTDVLPGSCFALFGTVSESPLDRAQGGSLSLWSLVGDTVAAPTIKVLTATFTYGDVQLLYATYQQKQDAMAGKTYLDDLKNPLG